MANIAYLLYKQGKYKEAEKTYRTLLGKYGYPDGLSTEHVGTLRWMFHFTIVLDYLGFYDEADEGLNDLEDKMLKHLPKGHKWVEELREHLYSREKQRFKN